MRSVGIERCRMRQTFSTSLDELDPTKVSSEEMLRSVRRYLATLLTALDRVERPTPQIEDLLWSFFDRQMAGLLVRSLHPGWLVVNCECGREECLKIVQANGRRPHSDRI